MAQYGFFFDQSRCSGCRACTVACKNWNGLPPGPLKYLRIYEYEKGTFHNTRIHFQWVPCYHCEEPTCVSNCPSGAIYKEHKYGAVLIDSQKCDGCHICYDACPYGALVFGSDEIGVKAQKCTMCIDRLDLGLKPICVLACPNRALDFGLLKAIIGRYGNIRDLEDMPSSQSTKPSVLFKPHSNKQQLIPYNNEKAWKLMMERNMPSQVYMSPIDVTSIPRGVVGRGELVIKHKSAADLMSHTRNDEG
jgi:anaerobic dimethyl sulfoxide reductase subunit B (iron-sulfur subunit)